MPIDPTIFLRGYQGPVNPTQILAHAQQLKNAGLETQLRQQQVQSGQLSLNEQMDAIAKKKAIESAAQGAFQTPAPVTTQQPAMNVGGVSIPGGQSTVQGPAQLNRGMLLSNVGKVDPMAAVGMQSQFSQQDATQQKLNAEIEHTKAETLNQLSMVPEHQIDTAMKHLDATGQALIPALNAPPGQEQPAWEAGIQQLVKSGVMPAQEAQQHIQFPGREAVIAQYAATKAGQEFLTQKRQAAQDAQNEANRQQQMSLTKRGQDITLRGQNMVDARAKEANAQKFGEAQLTPAQQDLVDQIGQGKMPLTRLDYLATRNPGLLAAVSARYPEFDGAKIKSYVDATKDFTSGKTATQVNSGATALGHLKELKDLNTVESHIPHTPAWTAYQNKATTLATELAKFYGDATIPAISSIKDSLTSTLPGNRDAAIQTQAQSMGDKFDSFDQQWKNAAPSSKYQAPMPGMSEKAKAARAALDPNYAAQQQPTGGKVLTFNPTTGKLE